MGPSTRWRIVAVEGRTERLVGLDVELTIDTTSPPIVAAVEQAAASNAIALERIDESEQQE